MTAMFEEAIRPLLDALTALEQDVTGLETELAKLKDQRNRLRQAVRAVAPERLPSSTQPQPKRKPTSGPQKFGPATAKVVLDFIEANMNGEVFTTKLLAERPGYEGPSRSTLSQVLQSLHEAGALRLVRRGRGGERSYEVIR